MNYNLTHFQLGKNGSFHQELLKMSMLTCYIRSFD